MCIAYPTRKQIYLQRYLSCKQISSNAAFILWTSRGEVNTKRHKVLSSVRLVFGQRDLQEEQIFESPNSILQ